MAALPFWVLLVSSVIYGSTHMAMANLGLYDPDGPGPLHSIVGEIVEEGPEGRLLVIHHNLEERTYVKGGTQDPGFHGYPITYVHDGQNIPIESVKSAVDEALSCEYFLTWECHHAIMTNYSWFIDYNSLRVDMNHVQGTFCTAEDGSRRCICDENDATLRVEAGTLTNYERFPLREIRAGEVNHGLEFVFMTLSPLKCQMPSNACEPPSNPAFGLVTGINFTYGHVIAYGHRIAYQCASGYSMHGDSTAVCQPNGEWSAIAPTCREIRCQEPCIPEHGHRIGEEFTYHSVVQFTCEEGYVIDGSNTIVCKESGSWSDSSPRCQAVTCPPLPLVANGVRVGDVFEYGVTIDFLCFPGYELVGERSTTCLASRQWSHSVPSCMPTTAQ